MEESLIKKNQFYILLFNIYFVNGNIDLTTQFEKISNKYIIDKSDIYDYITKIFINKHGIRVDDIVNQMNAVNLDVKYKSFDDLIEMYLYNMINWELYKKYSNALSYYNIEPYKSIFGAHSCLATALKNNFKSQNINNCKEYLKNVMNAINKGIASVNYTLTKKYTKNINLYLEITQNLIQLFDTNCTIPTNYTEYPCTDVIAQCESECGSMAGNNLNIGECLKKCKNSDTTHILYNDGKYQEFCKNMCSANADCIGYSNEKDLCYIYTSQHLKQTNRNKICYIKS